jgi:hypothetical protein
MPKPKPKVKPVQVLFVEILEAKPNKMFTEQQRQQVRFLRYNHAQVCPACGKKRRILWTMLCQFKAGNMDGSSFVLQFYPQSFSPLTGVCGDHPLSPDWPKN